MGPDVAACRDAIRPELALYIGGMGARSKNFYNDMVSKMGFEGEAKTIQDLYLDGKKNEAAAAVPDALIDAISLCGPAERIRDRLAGLEGRRQGRACRHDGAEGLRRRRAARGGGGGVVGGLGAEHGRHHLIAYVQVTIADGWRAGQEFDALDATVLPINPNGLRELKRSSAMS